VLCIPSVIREFFGVASVNVFSSVNTNDAKVTG